ncbi:hypothetical protein STEG23_035981 [Scotinomys teguina]
MAPVGRKRKATPGETVDKREKLAECLAVVIEHCGRISADNFTCTLLGFVNSVYDKLSFPGDVEAFMIVHGQTSAVYLEP